MTSRLERLAFLQRSRAVWPITENNISVTRGGLPGQHAPAMEMSACQRARSIAAERREYYCRPHEIVAISGDRRVDRRSASWKPPNVDDLPRLDLLQRCLAVRNDRQDVLNTVRGYANDQDSDSTRQVLLIRDVLVKCKQNVELGFGNNNNSPFFLPAQPHSATVPHSCPFR